MTPAKTTSACKQAKRSQTDISLISTDENSDDHVNNHIIEDRETSRLLLDQPLSNEILPTTQNPTTDQSSSSSPLANYSISPSVSNNSLSTPSASRSTPQPVNRPSSSMNPPKSTPSASRSTPQPVNRPSSSNNPPKSTPSASRSTQQPVNHSSSSTNPPKSTPSASRSTPQPVNRPSSSNNPPKSTPSASRSTPQPVNRPSSSNNPPKQSLLSNNPSSPSSSGRSAVDPANRLSSSLLANRSPLSLTRSANISPSSLNRSSLLHPTTDQLSSSTAATSSSSSTNTEPSSSNNSNDDLQDNALQKESLVWQYAKRNIDNQTATCTKCNAVIKTTNWSTTGLRKHLTGVHKIQTLTPIVSPRQSKFSYKLKKELHHLIIKSIIQDSRSFNDFRRPGMLKFLKKALPGYVPPHRLTVAKHVKRLNGFYQQRLKQQILNVSKLSITCDFWSDRSKRSYLCVTGHHVSYDFNYNSTILSFNTFYDRHFGVRIAKVIKEKLNNLNVFNKIQCITSDGAANMRTMYENLKDNKLDWIWCIAHRYHLTINNAFGFWPEKKKKKKNKDINNNDNIISHNDNNNSNNNINNNDNIISHNDNNNSNNSNNNVNNNYNTDNDDTADTDDYNGDEDNSNFWDDAVNDRYNEEEDVLHVDHVEETDLMDFDDDDNDDEISTIAQVIYGVNDELSNVQQINSDVTGEPSNVQQINSDVAGGDSNILVDEYVVDDETFIDYMQNNGLLTDDWDMNLNQSNNVIISDTNKKIIYLVIQKCRSFITMLKQSTVLNSYFERIRPEFDIKRTLPTDCITRWNSTYFLIDSFNNAKNLIVRFFGDKNLYDVRRNVIQRLSSIELHLDDWELLTDLRHVLKPFYLATRLMSIRSYPTAGLCYYTVKFLLKFLMKDEKKDSSQIKLLKFMLLAQFEYYFISDNEQLNVLKRYAFFDPLGYSALTEDDLRYVEQGIKETIRNENLCPDELSSISQSNSLATATASSIGKVPSVMHQFLLACGETPLISHQQTTNRRLTIDEELLIYEKHITDYYRFYELESSALHFWKENYTYFPMLAQLARDYLSTPGTSISSEAAFSLSAYVARKERARLSPDNLCYTVFMKDKIAAED